jgi:hypothetical protein
LKTKPFYIAIDFDGTCVTHEYPLIGKSIHAEQWLKEILKQENIKLILNTIRSDVELEDAVKWFEQNEIELYGVNDNPDQRSWSSSPKVYANIYIDDASFGCPLIYPIGNTKPYVNWNIVGPEVIKIIKKRKVIK